MAIFQRVGYLSLASMLFLGSTVATLAASVPVKKARTLTTVEQQLVGTYRCRSYNVSGGGGNCRLAPPIVLKADGTYAMSSEKGTFRVSKEKLTLSASKLRGLGSYTLDPATITFSYSYRGWRHVITYGRTTPSPAARTPTTIAIPETVQVDLTINFPESDGSVDWINVIMLVPQGQTPASAPYRPESLAVQEGRTPIVYASFFGMKEVKVGTRYDVYASSGFDAKKVGTLDVTAPTGPMKITITAQ